jgi:lipoate-protein ligase A
MTALRVLDTGLRGARANMAFGAALVEGRRQGTLPCTLRFFRFPPTVLIGRHQRLEAEIDLSRCRGVELARRMTGGGAVYIDERQICWELVTESPLPLHEATERICRAVAIGLSGLGVNARFRPGNDIEAGGRKICGTAGWVEGGVQLLHGTLLLDADIGRMAEILTPAADKLARHGASGVAERVTSLKALLGTVPSFDATMAAVTEGVASLGFSPYPGVASHEEERAAASLLAGAMGSEDFTWKGILDAD